MPDGSGFTPREHGLDFGDGARDGERSPGRLKFTSPAFAGTGSGSDDNGGNSEHDSNGERFDASIHSGRDKRNADGSWRKKRGRRAGTGSGGTRKTTARVLQANIDGLTRALVVVHAGLAVATKTPELALDDDDGKALAEATANFMAEFDVTIDPKTAAALGLIMTAGTVYGPKLALIRMRLKDEAEKRKAEDERRNSDPLNPLQSFQ